MVRSAALCSALTVILAASAYAAPVGNGYGAATEGDGFRRGEIVYTQHNPAIGCSNTGMRLALEKRIAAFRQRPDWEARIARLQCGAVPAGQRLKVGWVQDGTVQAWATDTGADIPPLWYMPADLGTGIPAIESGN
ncbi:hypothetical protein [Komagataeibacter xylinus]|uniref:Uncharacterized protein n=1 Tax=Komagataeibacter xylinus TaxID=28448 RepID=A0A857FQ17_KOMXY|nr:hypothetical protein [Komagataeibacter xylinus]QHC36441.1 hypothetical protein FMA36_13875 [Komagataeibacter xylinus]